MSTQRYSNRWIPEAALKVLAAEVGPILDVGGGAAPYHRAVHIVDVQPFDAERLRANQWGGGEVESGRLKRETPHPGPLPQGEREGRRSELETGDGEGVSRRNAKNAKGEGSGEEPEKCGVRDPTTQQLNNSTTSSSLPASRWTAAQYTPLDVCKAQRWPFDDKQFALGLCSHCLEDLRDPMPALEEMNRVCRRVLIIAPSRLLEQTRGIDHPRYCGFYHHPWMVTANGNDIVFRRKTPNVLLGGCHLDCPPGMTLRRELGAMYAVGAGLAGRELAFWSEREDVEEYRDFIRTYLGRKDLFEPTGEQRGVKFWYRHLRRRWMGVA